MVVSVRTSHAHVLSIIQSYARSEVRSAKTFYCGENLDGIINFTLQVIWTLYILLGHNLIFKWDTSCKSYNTFLGMSKSKMYFITNSRVIDQYVIYVAIHPNIHGVYVIPFDVIE